MLIEREDVGSEQIKYKRLLRPHFSPASYRTYSVSVGLLWNPTLRSLVPGSRLYSKSQTAFAKGLTFFISNRIETVMAKLLEEEKLPNFPPNQETSFQKDASRGATL